MKSILTAFCCTALLAAPAFAQKKTAGTDMNDQDFVTFAAQTDMVEANLGRLTQTNASSQEVKDFGQTLMTDHTQDFGQLNMAAQQGNLTVPDAIDPEHNNMMIGPLEKLKRAAFDKKFAQEIVAGHTKAVEVYKKEAQDAQNPALKSYAQTALPTLQKRLDAAKALKEE